MKTKPVQEKIFKPSKKHQKEKIENAIKLLNEIVKVRIAPSKVHGVGVVAMRDLKKGEKLYLDAQFQWLDVPYKKFKELRPEVRELILERWPLVIKGSHFVYPDTRLQAYCNHSDFPNYDNKTDTTLTKIYAGEEITEDYKNIEGWETVYPWIKHDLTQKKTLVNREKVK